MGCPSCPQEEYPILTNRLGRPIGPSRSSSPRDHRERDRGWMAHVMQNRLDRGLDGCTLAERCTGVGIRRELRIVAAGDLEADVVALSEFVARRPDLDL